MSPKRRLIQAGHKAALSRKRVKNNSFSWNFSIIQMIKSVLSHRLFCSLIRRSAEMPAQANFSFSLSFQLSSSTQTSTAAAAACCSWASMGYSHSGRINVALFWMSLFHIQPQERLFLWDRTCYINCLRWRDITLSGEIHNLLVATQFQFLCVIFNGVCKLSELFFLLLLISLVAVIFHSHI